MIIPFSRPFHYFAVAASTQVVLGIAAALILLPTGLLPALPWRILAMLLTYNVVVATLIALIVSGRTLSNSKTAAKGTGLVLGHFVGLSLGAFLGWNYGGAVWAIVSGAVMYFAVGWVGSHFSLLASAELARLTRPRTDAEKLIRASERDHRSWHVYGAGIPSLMLLVALLARSSGWALGEFANMLPAARVIGACLSLLSILSPWLLRFHSLNRRVPRVAQRRTIAIGVALSLAPAAYGLLIYLGFGLPVSELFMFALAASIATATWGASAAGRHTFS